MSWAKLDDGFHAHSKTSELLSKGRDGERALALWTRGLSLASANLSDGSLKTSEVVRLVPGQKRTALRLADMLVEVGFWEPAPDGDGWVYHDYHDYNPSRDQVLADRSARRKGAEKTNARRWGKVAPAMADSVAPATGQRVLPSLPVPTRPKEQREAAPALPARPALNSFSNQGKISKTTRIPDTWADTDAWCVELGIPKASENTSAKMFTDNFRDGKPRTRDWLKARWATWVEQDEAAGKAPKYDAVMRSVDAPIPEWQRNPRPDSTQQAEGAAKALAALGTLVGSGGAR